MPVDPTFRLLTGTGQNVASATGSSTASNPFATSTLYVRVVTSTAGISIRIDAGTPTAVATDTLLAPNYPEYFTVQQNQRLAAIGGPGTVNVTELS